MKVRCASCKRWIEKCTGAVNRARKSGSKLFCDKHCFGLSRRRHKTHAQKIAEKREYDIAYRRKNITRIKAEKQAWFRRTYDPAKAAKVRKAKMHLHVAYCRQPRYKRWKRKYDTQHRAKKMFGPYAESFLILQKIEKEVASRMSRYDIQLANGTLNKAQLRRREHERLIGG
jgi:hypothetical protein